MKEGKLVWGNMTIKKDLACFAGQQVQQRSQWDHDNSIVVDSDSEKGVQVENYDTEFEQDTYVSFVHRKFGKIYPEEEKYYVGHT